MAQPSLSQALRAFEAELGVELFHRVGRGLRLAVAGEALVGPARQILRAIDEARNTLAGVIELKPDAPARTSRSLGTRDLAAIPLVVSPPGTSTRILLEQALAAVGVTPQIAVQTAAREAIVPLVLAGAGAALLPAPLAREAQRRGHRAKRPAPNNPKRGPHTPTSTPVASGTRFPHDRDR